MYNLGLGRDSRTVHPELETELGFRGSEGVRTLPPSISFIPSFFFLMFIFIYLFIWLHRVLVVAHRIFHLQHEGPLAVTCQLSLVACGNLVSWPGIKPGPLTLWLQGLSLWEPQGNLFFLASFWVATAYFSSPSGAHSQHPWSEHGPPPIWSPCTASSLPIRPPLWCVSHASFSFLWVLKVSISPPPRHCAWGPPTLFHACCVYVVPVRTLCCGLLRAHGFSRCHPAILSHSGSETPCLGSLVLSQAKDTSPPPFYKTYKAQQVQGI